jgi:hypothetical protein
MDAMGLETLVKLASAGTSGVCILAIFWSGYSLQHIPPGAPIERYRSLRHFMTVALAVAIVSASAASINAFFNYRQNVALQRRNESLALANGNLRGEVETLGARAAALKTSCEQAVRSLDETQAKYTALKQDHEVTLKRLGIQTTPKDNEETRDPGSQ